MLSAATFPTRAAISALRDWSPGLRGSGAGLAAGLALGSGRLSLIGAKQAIFERGAIEAADDGIHLFRVGCVNKSKTLGFLGLRVPNHLDIVVNEVFRVEPRLDVVFGDPDREVSEEDSKTHLMLLLTPSGDLCTCIAGAIHGSSFILTQGIECSK